MEREASDLTAEKISDGYLSVEEVFPEDRKDAPSDQRRILIDKLLSSSSDDGDDDDDDDDDDDESKETTENSVNEILKEIQTISRMKVILRHVMAKNWESGECHPFCYGRYAWGIDLQRLFGNIESSPFLQH